MHILLLFCCYLGKLWVSVFCFWIKLMFHNILGTKIWLTLTFQNGSSSLHFTIDEERLAGYCQACGVLTSSSDDVSQQATPYSQIHSCMKSGNYQVGCLNKTHIYLRVVFFYHSMWMIPPELTGISINFSVPVNH